MTTVKINPQESEYKRTRQVIAERLGNLEIQESASLDGYAAVSTGQPVVIMGSVTVAADAGTAPILRLEARRGTSASGSAVVTRPLLQITNHTTSMIEVDVAGNIHPTADNAKTCGKSGKRWSAIWAGNGVIQTSDERLKNFWTSELGLDFIMALRPIAWRWKDGEQSMHYGLSAQQVAEVAPSGFAGHIYDDETDAHSLVYTELIAPLISAIQEQQRHIEALEHRISELERKHA